MWTTIKLIMKGAHASILVGTVLVVLIASAGFGTAYAQYFSQGTKGGASLEESLKLAKERVTAAEEHPSTGSGTPFLAADGVLGAMGIAGAVFGGIAAAFYIKGRSGRYAAIGRG